MGDVMEKVRNYYLVIETSDGKKHRVKLENLKIVTAQKGGNYFLKDIDDLTHQYQDINDLINQISHVNNDIEIINIFVSTKKGDQFVKPIPIIDAKTPIPFSESETFSKIYNNNHLFLLAKEYGRCAEKWFNSYKSHYDYAESLSAEHFYQKLHAEQVSENYLLRRDFTLTCYAEQINNDKYLHEAYINNNGFMMKPPMYINAPIIIALEKPVVVKESATGGQFTKSATRKRNLHPGQQTLF